MKNITIILFLIFSLAFSSEGKISKENFKLIESNSRNSSILFESEPFDLESVDGKKQFLMNDLSGYTMEEGYPQLPVYSTLFQINPSKTYKIDYEIFNDIIE